MYKSYESIYSFSFLKKITKIHSNKTEREARNSLDYTNSLFSGCGTLDDSCFFLCTFLYCIRYSKVLCITLSSQKKNCETYFVKIQLTGTDSLLVQSTKNNATNKNATISHLWLIQMQQITLWNNFFKKPISYLNSIA